MDLRCLLAFLLLAVSPASAQVPPEAFIAIWIFSSLFGLALFIACCCAICKCCCTSTTTGRVIALPSVPQQQQVTHVAPIYLMPQPQVQYAPEQLNQTPYGLHTSQGSNLHIPPPPSYGDQNAALIHHQEASPPPPYDSAPFKY